jgi:hypothetical protein
MKTQNKFNCFQPVTFEKSIDKKTGVTNYKFRSVVSDSSKDSDDEEIEPDGVDVKDFVNYGLINYNHLLKSSPKALIGEPTKAFVKNGKLVVEGILYGENKLTQDIIETVEMLEKSGSKRKIGCSIEGVPILRSIVNPKRILKAKLTGCAFTFMPKNKNTWVQLVKGEQSEDFVDYEFEKAENPNGSTDIEYLVDITDQEKGVRVTMNKELTIKIEKCMTTDSPSGKAIKKESLEPDLKNLSFKSQSDEFNAAVVTIAEGYKLGMVDENMKQKVVDIIQNKK